MWVNLFAKNAFFEKIVKFRFFLNYRKTKNFEPKKSHHFVDLD